MRRCDVVESGTFQTLGAVLTNRAVLGALLCSLASCTQQHVAHDAPTFVDCGTRRGRPVDVLWVVQNWSSSYDLRYQAGFHVGPLVRALESAGTGEIRMGLTSGAVGPAGAVASGCGGGPARVLDGVLVERADGPGRFFGTSSTDIELLAGQMFGLDNDGCGNSLLEAAVRALAPADFDLPRGVTGAFHGDVENAGFVDAGDVVLVVLVTKIDDCSWNETVEPGQVVVERCTGSGEPAECCTAVVQPTSRYLDAFARLEARLEVDIVLASLTAVPEPDVTEAEWRERPTMPCVDSTASVRMPWRILEVTDALRPDATSQPGCYTDDIAVIEARAAAIAERVVTARCD